MCVPIFLICLAFSLTSSNARAAEARSGHRNFLLRGFRKPRRFRGVNDVRVGRPSHEDRPGLEQEFDRGIVAIFRDREAFEKFEHDPRRGGALDAMLQPLVRRYAVYNFATE